MLGPWVLVLCTHSGGAGGQCSSPGVRGHRRSNRVAVASEVSDGDRQQVKAHSVHRAGLGPGGRSRISRGRNGARVPSVHGDLCASPEGFRLGCPRGLGSNHMKGGRGRDEMISSGRPPPGQWRWPSVGGSQGRGDTRTVRGPRCCSAAFFSPFQNHGKGQKHGERTRETGSRGIPRRRCRTGGPRPTLPAPDPWSSGARMWPAANWRCGWSPGALGGVRLGLGTSDGAGPGNSSSLYASRGHTHGHPTYGKVVFYCPLSNVRGRVVPGDAVSY